MKMCLTLKILWQHIEKHKKSMKTEVNPFSIPKTRKWFPLLLNGVLQNVLFCAQLSSTQAHSTYSVCFITQLFRFIWGYWKLFPILCPNCALWPLIHLTCNILSQQKPTTTTTTTTNDTTIDTWIHAKTTWDYGIYT